MFLNAKMTAWEEICDFNYYDKSTNIALYSNNQFHIKT